MKTITTILITAVTTALVTASIFMNNFNYLNMSSVTDFEATDTGVMLYTVDGAGWYWGAIIQSMCVSQRIYSFTYGWIHNGFCSSIVNIVLRLCCPAGNRYYGALKEVFLWEYLFFSGMKQRIHITKGNKVRLWLIKGKQLIDGTYQVIVAMDGKLKIPNTQEKTQSEA